MPDRQQTVDRSNAGDLAAEGAGKHASREPNEAAQARAGQDQPASQESAQAESPDAQAAPGGDGRRASADETQASDADESALQGDVDELVDLAAQRDEYLALAQRTQADFENYRKRVEKEANAAQQRGIMKLVEELLPALDNLERALEEGAAAAERDGRDAPLLQGVRLVRSELHAALERIGIESFSPRGERFDPAEHEAMAQQPVEGVPSGTVAEVFQPGYRLGDCIIRPARVLVAS
jgi:molecular chaperone GrpE